LLRTVPSREDQPSEGRAECLEILTKESQRLNKLLTNFLDFASPRLPRRQKVDPRGMVQSVTALAQHAARRFGVSIEIQQSGDIEEVECDQEQIKQLLLNLILNAIQATDENGQVFIRLFRGENLCIEVCDRGRGITAE